MAPVSLQAGNVVFWLVLLMFLPSVLGAFRLTGTLGPVQDMLGQGLALLPNIFAAAVIGFVGWIVARVLRGLVTNLLAAAGTDRMSERVGLDPSVKLSRLAGTLVFLLVLVPSLIAALDALKIEAVSGPATMMLGKLLDAVPHILAAAIILVLTWYVARFAAALLSKLLDNAGVDGLPERVGLTHVFSGTTRPSALAHWAVMFFAMLFAVVEASDQLGFSQVRDVVTTFIGFAGEIVLGGADPGGRLLAGQPGLPRDRPRQRAEHARPGAGGAHRDPGHRHRDGPARDGHRQRDRRAGLRPQPRRGGGGRGAVLRPRRPRGRRQADGALADALAQGLSLPSGSGPSPCGPR